MAKIIAPFELEEEEVIEALGYAPEDPANKNQPDGYAGLDSEGKVSASQLPPLGSSAPFADNVALVKNSADPTKLFRMDASGIEAGNTRGWSVPDRDDTFAGLKAQTFIGLQTINVGGLKLANNIGVQGTRPGGQPYNTIILDNTDTLTIGGLGGQGAIGADINASTFRIISSGNIALRVQTADIPTSRVATAIGSGNGEMSHTLNVSDRAGNDTTVAIRAGTSQAPSSKIFRTLLSDGTTQTLALARDGYLIKYNGADTAGIGAAIIYAAHSLTEQTADIVETNLRVGGATAPAGLYRVDVYVTTTTPGSTGTVTVVIGWTDSQGARTGTPVSAHDLSATGAASGSVLVDADGVTDITFATDVSGAAGSPEYSIIVVLTRYT